MLHCFLCETIQLNYKKLILFPSLHVLICSSMVVSTSQREHQLCHFLLGAQVAIRNTVSFLRGVSLQVMGLDLHLLCYAWKIMKTGRTCRTVGVIHSYTNWRNFGILPLQDADWDCFFPEEPFEPQKLLPKPWARILLTLRMCLIRWENIPSRFFSSAQCFICGFVFASLYGQRSLTNLTNMGKWSLVINYPLLIPKCLQ